jgi:predicted YcjX-like family ATPase
MTHVSSFEVWAAVDRQTAIVDAPRMVESGQVIAMTVLPEAARALVIASFDYGARPAIGRMVGERKEKTLEAHW